MKDVIFQYILTPFSVFIIGYILIRIMGKKAVSEMGGIDLIVIMILGTAISEPIVSKKLGIASWYSVVILLSYLAYSYLALNKYFKNWLHPKPGILIQDGQINLKALKKEKFTVEQLLAQLRVKGYTSVQNIHLAIVEQTGEFSVIPKADIRPVQPSDMKISVTPSYVPVPIIIDGKVLKDNLNYINHDMDWIKHQLNSNGLDLNNLSKVMLATLNLQGYLDFFIKESVTQVKKI